MFRTSRISTLLLWAEQDQYLSIDAARAYKRDLPEAELVKFDGGHWLLESHSGEVNDEVRAFLANRIGRSTRFDDFVERIIGAAFLFPCDAVIPLSVEYLQSNEQSVYSTRGIYRTEDRFGAARTKTLLTLREHRLVDAWCVSSR